MKLIYSDSFLTVWGSEDSFILYCDCELQLTVEESMFLLLYIHFSHIVHHVLHIHFSFQKINNTAVWAEQQLEITIPTCHVETTATTGD